MRLAAGNDISGRLSPFKSAALMSSIIAPCHLVDTSSTGVEIILRHIQSHARNARCRHATPTGHDLIATGSQKITTAKA